LNKVYFLLIVISITIVFLFFSPGGHSENVNNGDYVILLHGMGRTSFSMNDLEESLSDKGYQVINFGYASTKYNIGNISGLLGELIEKECPDRSKKIHFGY